MFLHKLQNENKTWRQETTLFLIEFTTPQCVMDSAPRVLVKEGSIKVVAGNKNALNTISIKNMTKWVRHIFAHDLAKSAKFWEGNHLSIDPAGLWTLWKNDFGFLSECFSWKIRYPMSLMSASFAYKLHFSNKQCLFCQICIKCTKPDMALSYWPISMFKNIWIVQ